ncbi:hypothetical protein VKT23_018677 [Stygiomarasmius scandens]|uniref:F-box domain-containing protein n=1 Tax=Marasmiellus scandens TaxID=2682957 RepID=A0ABR1ISH5_9AGAR
MPRRNRQKKRTEVHGSKRLSIQVLPNEVLSEIMRLSASPEHALLLRASKLFYRLGKDLLYRSIWLTSDSAVHKLYSTFVSSPGAKLAAKVRYFEVIICQQTNILMSIITFPSSSYLTGILRRIINVEILQLHIESLYLLKDVLSVNLFDHLAYSKVHTFSMTLLNSHSCHHVFRILRTYPSLQHLSFHTLERPFRLSQPSADMDFEAIQLPELTSYTGPMEILKIIIPRAKKLSSIVIDSGVRADTDLVLYEQELKSLELLENTKPNPAQNLSVEVIVLPDPSVVNAFLKYLPGNLASLSFRYTFHPHALVMTETAPVNFQELERFKDLKTFSMSCVPHKAMNETLGIQAPEVQKIIEAYPRTSLETIRLYGKVYEKNEQGDFTLQSS